MEIIILPDLVKDKHRASYNGKKEKKVKLERKSGGTSPVHQMLVVDYKDKFSSNRSKVELVCPIQENVV